MHHSTLIKPGQRAPARYNMPDAYDSDWSDSDSSSEESDVDNEEALERGEETVVEDGEDEESDEGDHDDSLWATNIPSYPPAEDRYASALAETDDSEAESLVLTREGFDTEDFDETEEEKEDDTDDFLSTTLEKEENTDDFLTTAFEKEGNKNESPLEEHEPIARLQVQPAPLTLDHHQIYRQPSLPAPNLLRVPKSRPRPHKPKGKGKEKFEEPSAIQVPRGEEDYAALWERQKFLSKAQYNVSNLKPEELKGRPQKRERVTSETHQSQRSEDDEARTPKRARLAHGKASTSAKTDAPILSASAKSSSQQRLDEVDKSTDYRPFLVPKSGRADYYKRLLEKYPGMEGEIFFAKERRINDETVIECPILGCGESPTRGQLEEHVRRHRNSVGQLTCNSNSHQAPKSFATEQKMATHIIKDHFQHYRCAYCDKELKPDMSKYVNQHLLTSCKQL